MQKIVKQLEAEIEVHEESIERIREAIKVLAVEEEEDAAVKEEYKPAAMVKEGDLIYGIGAYASQPHRVDSIHTVAGMAEYKVEFVLVRLSNELPSRYTTWKNTAVKMVLDEGYNKV